MRMLTVLFVAVVAAGCSSTSNAPAGPADGGGTDVPVGTVSCANDPMADSGIGPIDPVTLPASTPGASGALTFALVGPMNPNPPVQGPNSWTVKITDSTGKAVTDASVTFPKTPVNLNPWMPRMKHGSAEAMVNNNGDGTYTIPNLYFSMGGIWQLVVNAQTGATTDSVTYTFCVP
jgi:hypothetical protein